VDTNGTVGVKGSQLLARSANHHTGIRSEKMKREGLSARDGFFYVCDCCEIDDGRPTLVWKQLPGRKGHFCLCLECIKNLYVEHAAKHDNLGEWVEIKRKAISEKMRDEIFTRDGNACTNCGATNMLQIDHIIPFSLGGKTEIANLQTLCRSCNIAKRDQLLL